MLRSARCRLNPRALGSIQRPVQRVFGGLPHRIKQWSIESRTYEYLLPICAHCVQKDLKFTFTFTTWIQLAYNLLPKYSLVSDFRFYHSPPTCWFYLLQRHKVMLFHLAQSDVGDLISPPLPPPQKMYSQSKSVVFQYIHFQNFTVTAFFPHKAISK